MDEPAIRMWAWQQTKGWMIFDGEGLFGPRWRKACMSERINLSDELAAWLMSGKMLAPEGNG